MYDGLKANVRPKACLRERSNATALATRGASNDRWREKSAGTEKRISYLGNLAKVPRPVRRDLKSGASSGSLFRDRSRDLLQMSDLEKSDLDHKYPFVTRV